MSRTAPVYRDIFLQISGLCEGYTLCIWPIILTCHCKLLLFKEVWVCPWPVRTESVFHFSVTVFSCMFALAGRLIRLFDSDWGHLECFCATLKAYLALLWRLCVFTCVSTHAFDLNQLSISLPDSYSCQRKGSGLVLDQCQAMWVGWSAPHSVSGAREGPSLYPDLVLLHS